MAKSKEDYKKILEKIKEGQGGGNYSKLDVEYLDLKDSKNNVRVLPGHPNMDAFYVEKWQHQKGTGPTYMSVICLNHGDPRADECLIDSEDLEELRLSKDKDDKKKYNDQKAKPRYFAAVIDRDDDDKVKVLPCGTQILSGILEYVTDDEYGDILDPHEGRDLIITKTGKGMDTEYTVKPKVKTSPIFDDDDDIEKLIGTSAEDTKLPDLTILLKELEGEPDNALYIWRNGWKAFIDKQKAEGGGEEKAKKTTPAGKNKTAAKPAPDEDEEEAEGEEETPAITSYPKLKSRCAMCGDVRYKAPTGATCEHGHGGPQLADGARPTKPSKAYLKEFPEPAAEEETPVPLKSRCSVCGEKRFKTSSGISCPNGHGGVPKLEDGERPSKPSKAYLKEFPEPAEEEEEVEEEPAPKPAKASSSAKTVASGSTKAATTAKSVKPADDDEEGLDDLDAILSAHQKSKGK